MKKKIEHPFLVPDNFFEDFKNETITGINNVTQNKRSTIRNFVIQFSKYAAIIVFSFFLGRASISLLNGDKMNGNQYEDYSVDEVLMQINEDDITDFILEDNSIEMLNL